MYAMRTTRFVLVRLALVALSSTVLVSVTGCATSASGARLPVMTNKLASNERFVAIPIPRPWRVREMRS